MSGPKGGSYRVESSAERAARLLRDAKAQYARAETLLGEANSRLSSVEELTGQRLSATRRHRIPDDGDVDAYTRAANELEIAATAIAARATDAREHAARSAYNDQIEQMLRDITVGSASETASHSTGSKDAAKTSNAEPAKSVDQERINVRVQRRLSALAAIDHDPQRVRDLLADIAKARFASRADMLIGELDYFIAEAKNVAIQQAAAAAAHAELAAMQARVAELDGPPAAQLRARIADLISRRVEAIPSDLEEAVADAVRVADDEADRQCVVAAMRKALASLGYVVGPEFSNGLLGQPSVAYARNGASRYGVKIRLEPDSARFSAQAVKSDAELCSREEDIAAEREFCNAINNVTQLAKGDSVEIAFDTRAQPGEFPIQQVADAELAQPTASRSASRSTVARKQVRP